MDENLPDTNVGNIEYISKQDAVERMADVIINEFDVGTTYAYTLAEDELNLPSADVAQVVRCKDCIHNNDCDIQYSAQAGENFFCGFGETEKDVREDVYE